MMTNEHEDLFLKKVFANLDAKNELDQNFNKNVLHKINISKSRISILYIAIWISVSLFFILILTVILFVFGEKTMLYNFLLSFIPFLKPWHVFLVTVLIYFHFARTLLILAFLYFKKQLNFAFF